MMLCWEVLSAAGGVAKPHLEEQFSPPVPRSPPQHTLCTAAHLVLASSDLVHKLGTNIKWLFTGWRLS